MVRQDVNHKQYIRAIILLLVWLIFLPALSLAENEQYHGGSYDGYDAEVRNEIQLNGLDFSFICHGGSYDGYDMCIVEEIPLSNGIPCPENVVISISSNTVHIEWNAVSGASSYKVYSSDDLYSGFVEDTSGTFVGTSWSAQVSEEKKFYYITAETGRNSDMTTITPHTYIR